MKYLYISLLAGLLCQPVLAQVPTHSVKTQDRAAHTSANVSSAAPPTIRLKQLDLAATSTEAQRKNRQGELPSFGKVRPLALDLLPAGHWEPAAGGQLWKLTLTSPGALSLNFLFDKFFLPPGAELSIYNADRSVAIGPVTSAQNTAAKVFATDLLKGDAVTFELFEPAASKGQSILHAAQVVHGYQDLTGGQPYAGYGQAAPCNVDINCAAGNDWRTESNAVALIILPNGQYSTGTLLNRVTIA